MKTLARAAAPLCLAALASAQNPYRYEVLLETEQDGPYAAFFDPAMNSSGVVAVAASHQDWGLDRALLLLEGGVVREIVPASLGYRTFWGPTVAENGDVSCAADYGPEPNDYHILLWDASEEQLVLVADDALASLVLGWSADVYGAGCDMNEQGEVVFVAQELPNGGNRDAVLKWSGGVLSVVAEAGPSMNLYSFSKAAIDEDGSVYALGRGGVDPWPSVIARYPAPYVQETLALGSEHVSFYSLNLEVSNGHVLYLSQNSLLSSEELVDHDVLAGTSSVIPFACDAPQYNNFWASWASFDSSGGLLFQARVGASCSGNQFGWFTGPNASTDRLALENDCLVGGAFSTGNSFYSRDSIDSGGRAVVTLRSSAFPTSGPVSGSWGSRVVLATPLATATSPGHSICDQSLWCPCNNDSQGCDTGCNNSTGGGAHLAGYGTTSLVTNDLQFQTSGLPHGKPALLFSADTKLNGNTGTGHGDGRLCAGGVVRRLDVKLANSAGSAAWAPGFLSSLGHAAGEDLVFQVWYRDGSHGACTGGFNFSNGYELTIVP